MPVSAAIALIPAAIQLGTSAVQNYKAKKIAKNNIRPEYVPNAQVLQNADLTASRASRGLGDASLALATQENQINLSGSLDAILRGGGTTNQIADLYSNNSDAMLKLAALDSQLQDSHIQSFLTANAAKGAENQSAWAINKYGPYADKAQLAAQLRQSAVSNFSGGINGLSSVAANYLKSTLYKSPAPTTPDKNFDVPVFMQENPQDKYNYGNVYANNPAANNYINSIVQAPYDPNAGDALNTYHNGLKNITPFYE